METPKNQNFIKIKIKNIESIIESNNKTLNMESNDKQLPFWFNSTPGLALPFFQVNRVQYWQQNGVWYNNANNACE